MKAATTVDYDFIPSDDKFLKHQGECVLDQFLGIYEPLTTRSNRPYFKLCKEFYKNKRSLVSRQLDDGIDEDDEASESVFGVWSVKDGICPDGLITFAGTSTSVATLSL